MNENEGTVEHGNHSEKTETSIQCVYTFENFIVGESNKFAYTVAKAVAEAGNERKYSPLIIYGNSGLGKTHLLYAIRNTVEKNQPELNVIYARCDDYAQELVEAIKMDDFKKIKAKYKNVDYLLIDNIQYLEGRKSTQEEFIKSWENLCNSGKQIVLTLTVPDKASNTIFASNNVIKNYLTSAIIANIQPPEKSLRFTIVKQKATLLGFELPGDVTEFIADNVTTNIRTLEGVVNAVIAHRDLFGEEITIDSVKKYLDYASQL